MTTS
ncbi:hypothetical protein D018_4207A, partial [Vibrio parahaemolyticus VP2007-007]|jgi:hypothetical protein